MMKKILTITSSPGGAASFSTRLSQAITERLMDAYPQSSVDTLDLSKDSLPHLEAAQIASFFTPAEHRSEEAVNAIRHSDKALAELMDADIIVMGVPMHNFSIPSTLKVWIDHVVRAGVTFQFTATGVEGMVKNKKVYLAIATGNIYSEGGLKDYDFTESYLRSILGFIGLTDITAFRAEGTAIPGMQETALQKAVDTITI